jgi:hypothetical protein
MPLFIQETFVDRDQNVQYGESGVYEAFTDDIGKLYKSLVQEYGRCTGRMYHDRTNAKPMAIGWVFIKRVPYDDSPKKKYLREVWVSVHSAMPTKTIEYHYAEVK